MQRRKIQLIAGTTYSVSLPKEWVKNSKLQAGSEVVVTSKADRTLTISTNEHEESSLTDFSLNVDEHMPDIDQVLFGAYYLGVENITLFSKKSFTKEVRAKIRKVLTHMSGVVVSYEDQKKMTIRILLDKQKIEINQLVYRISLIIDQSMQSIQGPIDLEEIHINENEIDRLFHLMTKIVSLSLISSQVLQSSQLNNVSLIPSYFLIGKKLENIGDNINHLAEFLTQTDYKILHHEQIFGFIKEQLSLSVNKLLKSSNSFSKVSMEKALDVMKLIDQQKHYTIVFYLQETVRFIRDIQDEIIHIAFYQQLMSEGKL